MGKGESCWEHVQTPQDRQHIDFFRRLYEKDQKAQGELTLKIPKTIHFIWVGPKSFPKESIANVESWVTKHPDWAFKFWTDRKRPLPHPKMELALISEKDLGTLYPCYLESTNYAEKSDLLRYEILQEEGGIYVDHDVVCFQSFDPLIEGHQFFCGLEPPHKPIGSSSISVCNNIIASIPFHPVLVSAIEKVKTRWSPIAKMYPGEDKESIIYRVFNRTFCAFEEAVFENVQNNGYKNVVFPAKYFNSLGKHYGFFSHHKYDGAWYQNEDPFEKLLRERLMKMAGKMNKILLINLLSIGMNIALAISIFILFKRKKYAA